MSQLALPISWSRRGGRESLLIHPANADAIALLRDPHGWPSHCMILTGPPKSGRTLIGQLFEAESGATIVDDADQADEQRLFHLWNEARDSGQKLLLIAAEAPPVWQPRLPDLRTRLATAAVARIALPDEAIAAALIVHALETAGSAFAPDVPEYVARRTARCYDAIDSIVARLNALSLASGQKLSIASVRQAFGSDGFREEEAAPGTDKQQGLDHRG